LFGFAIYDRRMWRILPLVALVGCASHAAAPPPGAGEVRVAPAKSGAAQRDSPAPDSKRIPDAFALALVVDRSGSMTGAPMQLTLDAMRAAVRELEPRDWITVVVFDSQPQTIVEPQTAAARGEIEAAIAQVVPGGGTNILPALERASQNLERVKPARRHVILLSDGRAPSAGLSELVERTSASGVTISTVALGSSADTELLAGIAERGHGRYHAVDDPQRLPPIFREEVRSVRTRP
jgi:Mg-chelatase subunit ChlD